MTRITFLTDKGRYKGYTVKGHACFNTAGPDILCSAISMASQMTANGIEEVAHVKVRREDQDGLLALALIGETNDIAQALVQSFDLAMQTLYYQYPAFITLDRVEWSE